MKQFILFLFLIVTTLTQAQVIKIEPKTVTRAFNENLSDPALQLQQYAKVTNLTNQEIRLKWTRVILDQPIAWDTQVCDNNACYIPSVSTNVDAAIGLNQPVVLAAGASFEMGLYVVPNNTSGKGSFQLIFALASNPGTPLDTITYNTSVNTTTSTHDINQADIKVFPNPASNYFEVSNSDYVEHILVYNLLGREVRSYHHINTGQQFQLEGLPDGLYLVSLIDERKGIVKTVRLNKRSFRP